MVRFEKDFLLGQKDSLELKVQELGDLWSLDFPLPCVIYASLLFCLAQERIIGEVKNLTRHRKVLSYIS